MALEAVARTVVVIAAASSVLFVTIAGRGAPVLLFVAFLLWNVSPFAALLPLNFLTARLSTTRTELYVVTVIVGLVLSASYLYFWLYPREHQPAAPYLVVPVIGWMAILALLLWSWKARSS